jgi:uncharacterized protein YoxC
MSLIDILLIILLIAASALCIALIYYLWKIAQSVKSIQTDMSNLSTNLQPLINSTSELAQNLSEITENARGHIDLSKNIIESVKDRVDTILEFEENVRKGFEGPIMSFIKEITAIYNGFHSFINNLKKKNS